MKSPFGYKLPGLNQLQRHLREKERKARYEQFLKQKEKDNASS